MRDVSEQHSQPLALDDIRSALLDSDRDDPIHVVEKLLALSLSGELLLRQEDDEARICLYEGKIAWAHVASVRRFLSDVLSERAGLSHGMLRALVDDCKRRGMRLGEMLVERDLIDYELLRRCLLAHVATHVQQVLEGGSILEARFKPRSHRYDERLLFSLEEVTAVPLLARDEDESVSMQLLGDPDLAYEILEHWNRNVPQTRGVALVSMDQRVLATSSENESVEPLIRAFATVLPRLIRIRAEWELDAAVAGDEPETHVECTDEVLLRNAGSLVYAGRAPGFPGLLIVGLIDGRAAIGPVLSGVRLLKEKYDAK
jgi:hypothetical protein